MRRNTLRILLATALLICALPVLASAQIYERYNYDRSDQRDVRDAVARLDNASARLESDLNSIVRGSGLELYISRRLIEAMDGNIWIESSGIAGDGSTFHFWLPAG